MAVAAEDVRPGWRTGLAFSLDGRLLTTVGDDQTTQLWNPAAGEYRPAPHRPDQTVRRSTEVYGQAFSPGGRLLATASYDETARVWD